MAHFEGPVARALLADGVACVTRRRGDGNVGLLWTHPEGIASPPSADTSPLGQTVRFLPKANQSAEQRL